MNEIDRWLYSGAGTHEGLRLLAIYAPNEQVAQLVTSRPARYGYLLKKALLPFAEQPQSTVTGPHRSSSRKTFRKEWTFLRQPDCPNELKILAADKITSYHNYVEAHEKLYSCKTLEECFDCAKNLIKNYKQNRKIHSEFAYYQEHGSILGRHEIFAEMEHYQELRTMSVSGLFRRRKNLEEAIWRNRDEIKKGDKPHLDASREARIEQKERELAEVNRMIENLEQY